MSKAKIHECTNCGKQITPERRNYRYAESGLSMVILQGIEVADCPKCGNSDVIIPRMSRIHHAIAQALANSPVRLTGEQLRYLRKHLGMSGDQLGRYLHTDRTKISKWEGGEDRIGPATDRLVRLLAAALDHAGATPVVLQVNDVMPAVKENKIDGIVTNWGNPLQDFNDYMKFHTDTQFYTSAFFIVMNRAKYDGLPPDARAAIDALSGDAWVAKLAALWDKWDKPVRDGASAPGHEVIVPDAATMQQWRDGLKPVTDRYIADLAAAGFPDARAAYDKLTATLRR